MKHTQGEWKATGLEIRHKDRSLILANVYEHLPVNQSRTEAEANAKLIAASPTMLDALKKAKLTIEYFNHADTKYATAYQDICEAIKKATE